MANGFVIVACLLLNYQEHGIETAVVPRARYSHLHIKGKHEERRDPSVRPSVRECVVHASLIKGQQIRATIGTRDASLTAT